MKWIFNHNFFHIDIWRDATNDNSKKYEGIEKEVFTIDNEGKLAGWSAGNRGFSYMLSFTGTFSESPCMMIFPRRMIAIWSASSASARLCVQRIMARSADRRSAIASRTIHALSGSIAEVGSSSRSTGGSCSNARTSASFWRMPFENSLRRSWQRHPGQTDPINGRNAAGTILLVTRITGRRR